MTIFHCVFRTMILLIVTHSAWSFGNDDSNGAFLIEFAEARGGDQWTAFTTQLATAEQELGEGKVGDASTLAFARFDANDWWSWRAGLAYTQTGLRDSDGDRVHRYAIEGALYWRFEQWLLGGGSAAEFHDDVDLHTASGESVDFRGAAAPYIEARYIWTLAREWDVQWALRYTAVRYRVFNRNNVDSYALDEMLDGSNISLRVALAWY